MQPQAPMPVNKNHHIALILAILFGLLFIATAAWGYSVYNKEQDYKNNSDAKSAAAVSAAEKQLTTQLQAQFDQKSKSPYQTFTGPSTYGSLSFSYPKTWSAYVDQTSSDEPLNGYFYPTQVPGINSGTAFALRVELVSQSYSDVVQQYQQLVSTGVMTATAYVPPKLKTTPNVQVGTLFTGGINQASDGSYQQGQMVVMKLRDKTLKIYTESNDYASDFNNTVLATLTFVP